MRRRQALQFLLAASPWLTASGPSLAQSVSGHGSAKGHLGHGNHDDHDKHSGHRNSATQPSAPTPVADGREASLTRVRLSDVELIDQDRRKGRLAQDFIGRQLVVATFVFAECGSYCPIISAVFAQFQRQMPQDMARETVMISLSLDPRNDTPDVLQQQARQFGSRQGWRWLTGIPRDVEAALKGFGAYSAEPVDHQPNIVIGDPVSGVWYRYLTTPTVAQMLKTTQQLLADRGSRSVPRPNPDHGNHGNHGEHS